MSILAEVTTLWGDAILHPSEPASTTVLDACFVPMRPDPGFSNDPEWGLYDSSGTLVAGAAYARGPGAQLVGQSPHRAIDQGALEQVDEEFVYGGPILLHYGHFVISSLARMWMICRERGRGVRRRILCHADSPPELWFQFDHVRIMLNALGLTPSDFVRLERPTRLRSIVVPHPSLEEQSYIHPIFAEVGREIGRACGVTGGPRTGRPAYISKTRLPVGINRWQGEEAIESELVRLGFDIVHPTDLPLDEQMRRLARARAITGSVGSAFHTSMFFPEPPDIVGVCPIDNLVSNFPLVDLATGARAVYLYPTEASRREEGGGTFHVTWTIADPAGVAREIAARV